MTIRAVEPEPLLRLENLGLSLTRRVGPFDRRAARILDNINLGIGCGEVVGIVGESGSGKTTLGKALLRLYQPTGRIMYGDRDLAAMSDYELRPLRRDLQMVFQDPLSSFNPRFKIGNSVALPLVLHGIVSNKRDAWGRAGELLRQVGLDSELCSRFPHQMSGGQLQRVAIARAIGIRPKLIVADEAVSKLDVSVRAQVLNLIRRANKSDGIAFVFITHDLAVARFLSDRIAVMYSGRIVEIGETEAIFANPRHPYTVSLLNARRQGQAIAELDNVNVEFDPQRSCNFAPRCARRQADCTSQRPELTRAAPQQSASCFHPVL